MLQRARSLIDDLAVVWGAMPLRGLSLADSLLVARLSLPTRGLRLTDEPLNDRLSLPTRGLHLINYLPKAGVSLPTRSTRKTWISYTLRRHPSHLPLAWGSRAVARVTLLLGLLALRLLVRVVIRHLDILLLFLRGPLCLGRCGWPVGLG